jgi:hypothetical protein
VQGGRYVSISSIAEYERKALLIAPEKNLIAVPFDCYQYDDTADHLQFDAGYGLYTYTEGHFTCSGVFYGTQGVSMERAIFIEQTVYLLSSKEILAVDLDTMQETDRMAF